MGLVNEYMVKNAIDKTAGQTLELEADPGQSFLIKDIMIGDTDAVYADLTVDKALVGSFRTSGELGNHLGFPYGMGAPFDATATFKLRPTKTILGLLGELGIFTGFPVADGQKIVISPSAAANYLGDISIVYEEYEGGDITSEMENGSESSEYFIVNYGDTGAAITTAGTHHVNEQNSPTEFPAFPYGKVVPAKTEIDLIGILASDAYNWATAILVSKTTYLKLVRERTVLFDDDRNGLLFRGGPPDVDDIDTFYGLGNSKIGNYSDTDIKKPFMLPTPITFGAGEELNMYITSEVETAANSIPQLGAEIGLIMKIRRVS
jgi:hypothetical protein